MTGSQREIESRVEDLSDDDGTTYDAKTSWVQWIGAEPDDPSAAPLAHPDDWLNPDNPHHRRWIRLYQDVPDDYTESDIVELINVLNERERSEDAE